MHVAAGRVIGAKHLHAFENLDAGCVFRHQNLRLLTARGCIGVGFDHHNHNLAARVPGARDIKFFAIDDPVIPVEHRAGADVLGIG